MTSESHTLRPSTDGVPSGGRLRARHRLILLFGVLALIVVSPLIVARRALPAVPQPVQFSHLRHAGELQLPCDFCHERVRQSAHAGLPAAQTCSICHISQQGESEESARMTELIQSGEPLLFNKLFRLPPHVFYTHRRHVEIGALECVNCHGEIAETDRPPERPLVRISMQFCLDCHEERSASTDCAGCHR